MIALRDGEWVRLDFFGRHFAVVLRALGAHCVIVYATSSAHRHLMDDCEEVWPDSADGRRLGLTAVTYFYPNNCIPVRSGKLESLNTRCPPKLFLKLRERCERQLASLENLHPAELDSLALSTASRTSTKGRS